MSRTGQILLEVLVAAILLVILIPHIPSLCWKYAGPDWEAYYAMVADNNALIVLNEKKAQLANLRHRLAVLEAATLKRKQDAAFATTQAAIAKSRFEHGQAMIRFNAFTDRQANLFAQCLAKTDGKISPLQKDRTINNIWTGTRTCEYVLRD